MLSRVTKVISHLAIIFASCLMRFFMDLSIKVIVQKVKVRVLASEPLTDATASTEFERVANLCTLFLFLEISAH